MHVSSQNKPLRPPALAFVSLMTVTLLLFAVPRIWSAEPKTNVPATHSEDSPAREPLDPTLVRELRAALQPTPGRRSVESIDLHVRAAQGAQPKDARPEYVFGLVLLEQLDNARAIKQFEAAVADGKTPYLPAWKALIRTQLMQKQYDAGFANLEILAGKIQHEPSLWPNASARTAAAEWLGRATAACALAATSGDVLSRVTTLDARFRSQLAGPLKESYEAGRRSISLQYDKLLEEIDQSAAETEQRTKEKLEARQRDLDNRKNDLDERSTKNNKTVEDWKNWLKDELDRNESEKVRLEKEFTRLQESSQTLVKLTADLQIQMQQLDVASSLVNTAQADPRIGITRLDQQTKMIQYQAQQHTLTQKSQVTSKKIRDLAVQRKSINQKYEKAVANLERENASVQKKQTAIKNAQEDGSRAAPVNPATRLRRTRLTRLATYLELDPRVEKLRLLAELK